MPRNNSKTRKTERRASSVSRHALYGPNEQSSALDERLGVGQGAVKERNKLASHADFTMLLVQE